MIFGYIRRKRVKYAFKAGKLEHRMGRWTGVLILFCYASYIWWPIANEVLLPAAFISWFIYLMSHKIEKKLFGKNGPRSNWGKKK